MARPTDYREEYCEDVLDYGRAGKSVTWIATEIGVCKQTVHNWMAAHPEFLDAMTRAKELAQRWWEDAGQDGLTAGGFNGSVWSRSMAARFPDDWREIKGTELSGPGGKPFEVIELVGVRADDHGTD